MVVREFHQDSGPAIHDAIIGRTVDKFEIVDGGIFDWLVFKFTDETELHIRYDWIYEWGIKATERKSNGNI